MIGYRFPRAVCLRHTVLFFKKKEGATMASYKERMENLAELRKSYEFTPEQMYQMTSYKVGNTGKSKNKRAGEQSERLKKEQEEQEKKLRILEYLKTARASAISRGVYNQNVYRKIEAEADQHV